MLAFPGCYFAGESRGNSVQVLAGAEQKLPHQVAPALLLRRIRSHPDCPLQLRQGQLFPKPLAVGHGVSTGLQHGGLFLPMFLHSFCGWDVTSFVQAAVYIACFLWVFFRDHSRRIALQKRRQPNGWYGPMACVLSDQKINILKKLILSLGVYITVSSLVLCTFYK